MEIERKWMVTNWPDEKSFPLTETYQMDQGYISVRPTVRIRREALQGGRTALVLCFKGAGTLSREEIETEIDADLFARLEHLIGKPLIKKERRSYRLPDGVLVGRGGVQDRGPGPRLGPRRRRPGGLPQRRVHRQARQQHGRLLAADPAGRLNLIFVKSCRPALQTVTKRIQ